MMMINILSQKLYINVTPCARRTQFGLTYGPITLAFMSLNLIACDVI